MSEEIKTFENYCNCGGFASSMNGRPVEQPHMTWCPQYREYAEWFKRTGGVVKLADGTVIKLK